MKRKLAILLCAFFMLTETVLGGSTNVNASGNYTSSDLTLTKVEDIDVYNDYHINNLIINNTLPDCQNGEQVYKFTLEHDGFVSLLLTARSVAKYIQKTGVATTESDATLTATVYRDAGLLYAVVPPVTAKGSTKGESTKKIALDQGTYYIVIKADKYQATTSGKTTTITSVKGNAELIIYNQDIKSNEVYRPSNVGKENEISIDSEFVGLVSDANPKDYYKFQLTNKALVKFNYMYSSAEKLNFVLYSAEREELVTKTVLGNSVWYNVEKYLEPGTYYCSLETTTVDGGQTNLLITQTIYPLKLTQKNTIKNSYITVSTIDEPKEVRCVKGKLNNSELTSNKWKNSKLILDDLKFGVNKTGYYTVRVTDEYDNMFMQSINVTQCDKTPPAKPVIKGYKAGSDIISGTAEKETIVTITINKKSYTCIADSKGNFRCELPSKLSKGTKIEVTAQDLAENFSYKSKVTVK